MKQRRVFVVGTGTAVGKTHASLALLAAAARASLPAAGLKPIESGVAEGVSSDASQLAAASTFHVKRAPYVLAQAVSPHRAARSAGLVIDIQRIVDWIDEHTPPLIITECAGGALSPLGRRCTNLDLAVLSRPTAVLIVAPDRLGVLHDLTATLLSYRALAPGLPHPIVLLQPPAEPDASTGLNIEDLAILDIAPNARTFPRGDANSAAVQEVAVRLLNDLMGATAR